MSKNPFRVEGTVVARSAESGMPADISYTISLETGQTKSGLFPITRPGGNSTEIFAAPVGAPAWITTVGSVAHLYVFGESIDFVECETGGSSGPGVPDGEGGEVDPPMGEA